MYPKKHLKTVNLQWLKPDFFGGIKLVLVQVPSNAGESSCAGFGEDNCKSIGYLQTSGSQTHLASHEMRSLHLAVVPEEWQGPDWCLSGSGTSRPSSNRSP